jgi:hypothetical protein
MATYPLAPEGKMETIQKTPYTPQPTYIQGRTHAFTAAA